MKDEQVEPQNPDLRNSSKGEKPEAGMESMAALAHEPCYWNEKKYSDGATVCDAKRRYECWNGRWVEIGTC